MYRRVLIFQVSLSSVQLEPSNLDIRCTGSGPVHVRGGKCIVQTECEKMVPLLFFCRRLSPFSYPTLLPFNYCTIGSQKGLPPNQLLDYVPQKVAGYRFSKRQTVVRLPLHFIPARTSIPL